VAAVPKDESEKSMNRTPAALMTGALLIGTLLGCGPEEPKYTPKSAATSKANIPPPPTLPQLKKKDGDAFTVAGIVHDMRSVVHRPEVMGKQVSLVGYIVKTNLVACKDDKNAKKEECAPACAVHKGGKGDPVECEAPVPTFWIADTKEEKTAMIPVMGWSSNYARIYDAIEEMEKATNLEKQKEVKIEDPVWGITLPNPLPAPGGKVKVTGTYSTTFARASSSIQTNPKYGIITVEKIEYLEEPTELATLPGMKERKKKDK
jgi:hypothetical protein